MIKYPVKTVMVMKWISANIGYCNFTNCNLNLKINEADFNGIVKVKKVENNTSSSPQKNNLHMLAFQPPRPNLKQASACKFYHFEQALIIYTLFLYYFLAIIQ